MSEFSFIHKYLAENTDQAVKEKKAIDRFKKSNEDVFLVETNLFLAEMNGFFRQRFSLNSLLSDFDILVENYRDYRKGEIDKDDYKNYKDYFLRNWADNIANQMFYYVVFESGSSGQYIQLLKGFGILSDDNIDELGPDDPRIKHLEIIAKKVISLEELDLDSYQSMKPSELLASLVDLKLLIGRASYFIEQKKQKEEETSDIELKILELNSILYNQLHYFFILDAQESFISPKRFQLFLSLARVKKMYKEVDMVISEKIDEYLELEEEAYKRGYEFDYVSDLFTVSGD